MHKKGSSVERKAKQSHVVAEAIFENALKWQLQKRT